LPTVSDLAQSNANPRQHANTPTRQHANTNNATTMHFAQKFRAARSPRCSFNRRAKFRVLLFFILFAILFAILVVFQWHLTFSSTFLRGTTVDTTISSSSSTTTTTTTTARQATPRALQACLAPPQTREAMLVWFTTLLNAHNIRYFLGWGTLLGAIRNQRIIPWTCDVDLILPDLWTSRSQARSFFAEFVCDLTDDKNTGGAANYCDNYCLLGKPNDEVFHLTFNPDKVSMELCRETGSNVAVTQFMGGGKPAYLDIYSVLNQNDRNSKKDWPLPQRTDKERHQNPYIYFVGSKWKGKPSGHFLMHDDVYPLNLTGATVQGKFYPTMRQPEKMLTDVFGAEWRIPDDSWEGSWCLFGWCWTKRGVYKPGSKV
jgi:hypothetical protein